MQFKILSHACLLVKSDTHSVIIDPWLIGSCYWRSWWNFPVAEFHEDEISAVDAVIISHVHWDHWHGPTLKKYFRGKRFIVPDEPSRRSRKDLTSCGFKNLNALPHGKTVTVGDISITLYQFGLFLNDAVVVIECDGVTILNANDAKMAGWSLEAVVEKHGPIDFALRSHSSANPRINFDIVDQDTPYVADDRDHYFRSFKLFMDAVQPHYAIPFASNHCHLHDEVFSVNSYISNPLQLRSYIESERDNRPWALKVMLPGSSWGNNTGFQLSSEAPFADISSELQGYRQRITPTLERNRAIEQESKIPKKTFDKFMGMLSSRPMGWGRESFALTLTRPDGELATYDVNLANKEITLAATTAVPCEGKPIIVMPAIIFKDAVWKNMFHHAGISKRCRFLASNERDLNILKRVFRHLEIIELGVLPLDLSYVGRFVRAYMTRWREVFVYLKALWLSRVSGKPMYLVEEIILKSTRPNSKTQLSGES
jgi:UDP-MurNAc hydroxylase